MFGRNLFVKIGFFLLYRTIHVIYVVCGVLKCNSPAFFLNHGNIPSGNAVFFKDLMFNLSFQSYEKVLFQQEKQYCVKICSVSSFISKKLSLPLFLKVAPFLLKCDTLFKETQLPSLWKEHHMFEGKALITKKESAASSKSYTMSLEICNTPFIKVQLRSTGTGTPGFAAGELHIPKEYCACHPRFI